MRTSDLPGSLTTNANGCAVDTIGGEIGLGTGSGAGRLAATTTEEPEDEEIEDGDMER